MKVAFLGVVFSLAGLGSAYGAACPSTATDVGSGQSIKVTAKGSGINVSSGVLTEGVAPCQVITVGTTVKYAGITTYAWSGTTATVTPFTGLNTSGTQETSVDVAPANFTTVVLSDPADPTCPGVLSEDLVSFDYTPTAADILAGGVTFRLDYTGVAQSGANDQVSGTATITVKIQSCDDADPCTEDTCVPDLTGLATCVHTPIVCDPCSPCVGGVCTPIVCDPCSPCVAGVCTPIVCDPCSPCVAGVCTPLVCDPCSPCVAGVCTPIVCDPCSPCVAGVCTPLVCDPCSPCVAGVCTPIVCDPCFTCVGGTCTAVVCDPCFPCDVNTGACATTTICGNAGCTPGFYKNCTSQWPVSTTTTLSGAGFIIPSCLDQCSSIFTGDTTLLAALSLKGGSTLCGGAQTLLRAAAAAYLNSLRVNYPLTTQEVIDQVNAALASCNRSTMLTLAGTLDSDNNLGCKDSSGADLPCKGTP